MAEAFRITIRDTGESYDCPGSQNLLQAMARLGRRGIPVGCRNGGCGVCKVRIEAGRYRASKMSRAHVSAAEEAAGTVLACRVCPQTDLELSVVGSLRRCLLRHAGGQAVISHEGAPSGACD